MSEWYAIYKDVSGELVSTGTVVADPLPTGLTKKKLVKQPDQNMEWNTTTRTFDDITTIVEVAKTREQKLVEIDNLFIALELKVKEL